MSKAASGNRAHALVFAAGDPVPAALATLLPAHAFVIAADGGLANARLLARHVDVLVGDFDSADPAMVEEAEHTGTRVERHPEEKDETDLELALDTARTNGISRITVVGGHGGRVDHFLANLLLLAAPKLADASIDAWIGAAHVTVIQSTAELSGAQGSLCTLLALGGGADGVRTEGLVYPLHDETLLPGSTRGVSNVFVGTQATVSVASGTLLAIQPDALEEVAP